MNQRIERIVERVKDIMDGDDDLEVFTEKFAELVWHQVWRKCNENC